MLGDCYLVELIQHNRQTKRAQLRKTKGKTNQTARHDAPMKITPRIAAHTPPRLRKQAKPSYNNIRNNLLP